MFLNLLLLFCTVSAAEKGNLFSAGREFVSIQSGQQLSAESCITNLGDWAKRLFPEQGRNFSLRILAGSGEKIFCEKRRSALFIFLPENADWFYDRDKLSLLAKQILLSAGGLPLAEAQNYPQCWLIDALILRCSREDVFPKSMAWPGGRTMLSSGVLPELQNIVSSELQYADGPFSYMLQQEWADILLELCMRSKFFTCRKAGMYLLQFPQAKKGKNAYSFFLNVFFPEEKDPENRFRMEAEGLLLNRLMPLETAKIESAYRTMLSKASGKKGLSCTELFQKEKDEILRIPQKKFDVLRADLLKLLCRLPPGTEEFFRTLVRALSEAYSEEKPSLESLAGKEKYFLESLAYSSAVEKSLAEAERKYVSPGKRYALMFTASEREDAENIILKTLTGKKVLP